MNAPLRAIKALDQRDFLTSLFLCRMNDANELVYA